MSKEHNADLIMPPGRGKPKKSASSKVKKSKPIRVSIFVDQSVKARIDSLALIKGQTTSQVLVSGFAALIRQLPAEDRELLEVIEQRRVVNQAFGEPDMPTVERAVIDTLLQQAKNKGSGAAPQRARNQSASHPAAKPNNVVQPDDPPVDEPEFES